MTAGGILAHQGLVVPARWSPPRSDPSPPTRAGSPSAVASATIAGSRRRRPAPPSSAAVALVERRPVGFIFAFRFLWGLRTVSPIAIGATKVSRGLFAGVDLTSAIVWAILFSGIGLPLRRGVRGDDRPAAPRRAAVVDRRRTARGGVAFGLWRWHRSRQP
ncbi:DedA family protein [Sphingomonas sp. MMS24-JH45]